MRKQYVLGLLGGALMLLGITACSDKDDFQGDKTANTQHVYRLCVSVNNNEDATTNHRKVLALNDQNVMTSKWKVGDRMLAFNCGDGDEGSLANYSNVEAEKGNTQASTFNGTIQSSTELSPNGDIAFFYPASSNYAVNNVVAAVKTSETVKDDNNNSVTIEYYLGADKVKKQILLNLSKQDGQLATIDANYDYNWGKTKPTEVNHDGMVKANVQLKRLVSFWGLKFKDTKGQYITNIKKLLINGVKSTGVLDLTNGEFIGGEQDKDYAIDVEGNKASAINMEKGFVWVALFPEVSQDITITLITTDGFIYTKDVHKTFASNMTYRSTITNMKMPKAEPYVEVAGTKWATGNFIHYTDGTEDYWGIAPAQWWISNYADKPTVADYVNGKTEVKCDEGLIGSQNWYIGNYNGQFSADPNDFDLFRWGDISDVTDFPSKKYLATPPAKDGYDISMKFYENNRPTTDRSKVTKGDIVYFYTTNPDEPYNYQYRYPKEEELQNLMNNSKTVIPAFCYTDKGNKIYGAYFSDATTGGITGSRALVSFPTGTNNLWKFEDVTGFVLANKGLFLPMAGLLYAGTADNKVQYRLVLKDSQARGQYWSSRQSALSGRGMAFGTNMWTYGIAAKAQGNCLRPVYVSGDETKPLDAAKYNMFRSILNADGTRRF